MSNWQPDQPAYGVPGDAAYGLPAGQGAPPSPATTPDASYPRLRQTLSTADGFERSVAVSTGADGAVIAIGAIAVGLLVWNIVSTLRTLAEGLRGRSFVSAFAEVFMQTDGNPVFIAMVWGPIVLIPVLIIAFILRRVTRHGSVMKAFERFQATGFIGQPVPTQVSLKVGNVAGVVSVVAAPQVPQEWAGACAQEVSALVNTDPKSPQSKDLVKAFNRIINGATGSQATRADAIDGRFPQGLWFLVLNSAAVGAVGSPRVFIPGDKATATVYQLKNDVPLA